MAANGYFSVWLFEVTRTPKGRKKVFGRYRVKVVADSSVDVRAAKGVWRFEKVGEDNKLTGESYDVRLDPITDSLDCGCMGFLSYGRCKHAQTLGVFLSGRLPAGPEDLQPQEGANAAA